jgi:hypothetical protein
MDRAFLPGVPDDDAKRIAAAARRPEGSFVLSAVLPSDAERDTELILAEIVSGQVVLRLTNGPGGAISFTHSSPGTGTRVATVADTACSAIWACMTWTPAATGLHVGSIPPDADGLRSAEGHQVGWSIRVGTDGQVYRVGDDGVEVMGVRVIADGELVLGPTAIEVWNELVQAAEVLGSAVSDLGFVFEVVRTNLTIVILATGFEAYTKTRFRELEDEGIPPVRTELERRFPWYEATLSVGAFVADRRVDFGNWDVCKDAFRIGYGVRFGDVVDSQTIERLRGYLDHRNRVVHVSAITPLVNRPSSDVGPPVFVNEALRREAMEDFATVIHALHRATLALRP